MEVVAAAEAHQAVAHIESGWNRTHVDERMDGARRWDVASTDRIQVAGSLGTRFRDGKRSSQRADSFEAVHMPGFGRHTRDL